MQMIETAGSNLRRREQTGFTLIEALVSLGLSGLAFAAVIGTYIQADYRSEWSGYALAAQSLAIQQLEQAKCAKWDTQDTPVVDEIILVPTTTTATFDLPIKGTNSITVTNYMTRTTVTNAPVYYYLVQGEHGLAVHVERHHPSLHQHPGGLLRPRLMSTTGFACWRSGVPRRGRWLAFTMPEMMIAMAVFSFITIGLVYTLMFVMRFDEMVSSKLGASEMSRRGFDSLTSDIRAAKIWQIGNGSKTSFTPCGNATNQVGNALQLSRAPTRTGSYAIFSTRTGAGCAG